VKVNQRFGEVQSDSKLLSGFPFILQGNPDSDLESLCISSSAPCCLLYAGFWHEFLFDPEDAADIFIQKVYGQSRDYTAQKIELFTLSHNFN
jgi:hypothetical protein